MRISYIAPVLAGAIAGAIVAAIIAGGNSSTTKTVTDVVSRSSAVPTAISGTAKTGAGLSINKIYRMDSPGVVDIIVETKTSGSSGLGGLGGLGGNSGSGSGVQEDEGAGVVYNSSGDIMTDEHVIANAAKVTVNFSNGKSYSAKVLGSDASTDVGVIKVSAPASELHPLTFADSGSAQVGDPVVAIGSPFELPETVTSGIVSQTGRGIPAPNGYTILKSIQTDAAINPGNSGGPLIDAAGQVLGLNDQIDTNNNSDQSSGVGFATPGNTDQTIANEIISGKKIQHSYVGVELNSTSTNGAEVTDVEPGSPAAKAGLRPGDVVISVDGKTITSTDQFIAVVSAYAPGQTVDLVLRRKGVTKHVKVTLGVRPKTAPNAG